MSQLTQQILQDVEQLPETMQLEALDFIQYLKTKLEKTTFQEKIPTSITKQTFDTTDTGNNITVCNNVDDMFNKLGI
ncbi:MAG: hypothetical protein QM487_16160 [Candidatus Marithrix sp.]